MRTTPTTIVTLARRNNQIRQDYERLLTEISHGATSPRVLRAARREAIDHLALDYNLSTETIRQTVAGPTRRTA